MASALDASGHGSDRVSPFVRRDRQDGAVNPRSGPLHDEYDVVVVGAGSAGSTFAGTLAARSDGRSILVLEAGPDPRAGDGPSLALDSLEAGADDRWSVEDRVQLADGRVLPTRRGRVVGGSGAVNGGYFIRPTARDLAGLVAAGDGAWDLDDWLATFVSIEHDLDLGDRPGHGADGPVPVSRDLDLEPVSAAFLESAAAEGLVTLDDLNGSADVGAGAVPFNAAGGRRVDAATAFLDPARERGAVEVQGSCGVRRVLLEHGRVRGVELDSGRTVRSRLVVAGAGTLGTAALLLRSGIGPADVLRDRGIEAIHPLAGVGAATFDHPCVDLLYRPAPGAVRAGPASFMQTALHTEFDGSVVEVMATRRPYGVVTGADPDDALLSLRVTLMTSRARGTVRLGADPSTVRLRSGVLDRPEDLAALAAAVRFASRVANRPEFRSVVERWHGPAGDELADDDSLGGWVRAQLRTSFHLSGSCRTGPADDQLAVVDGRGRVHGVEGLHVVDLSILPEPLSRGPAATAVALGALAGSRV